MREITLAEVAAARTEDAAETFQMDEESFRAFYGRTARPLWCYLARVSGDRALADDVLQETYLRYLRARPAEMSDEHRKNYLFRIATNLLRARWRRRKPEMSLLSTSNQRGEAGAGSWQADEVQRRADVGSVLRELDERERKMLWLAHVEGFSHKEIAGIMGLQSESVRPMLFRARQRLARLLREKGLGPGMVPGVRL